MKLTKSSVSQILEKYNVGEITSFSLIEKGERNSTYVILTNQGKFILKIYEECNIEKIMVEIQLLEKLSKANIPVPKIVKTVSNDYLLYLYQKGIAMFTFLDGKHIKNESANLKQIKSLGENLGIIHKNTMNFKPKNIELKNIYDYDNKWILNALVSIKKDMPELPNKYEKFVSNILENISIPKLVQGLNHGDFQEDNIMFMGNKVSGIIDFDDCFYGNLLSDVALFIGMWCIDKEIDFDKCKCFIQAYESKRKLTEKEKKYLYDQSKLFMLMHFTYWLWDEENWNDNIKPIKTLNNLQKITKEEFMQKIF
ncbi:homoserine kinase [Candidatus Woesearchaeota archaeon]|nr:homoserine kinase [Candidatus Woesearchaeota archaeon]